MNIIQCFEGIIGGKQGDPSKSGIFVTDLEALSTIEGLVESEEYADIDELLAESIRTAILKINTDVSTLMLRYANIRAPYAGKLGSSRYLKAKTEAGRSGIKIVCNPLDHGELIIRGIGMLFSQTGNVEVTISNNYDDTTHVLNLDTIQNRIKGNPINPITLPMKNEFVDHVVYTVTHENPFPHLDNRLSCSTCRKFYFNTDYPKFSPSGLLSYVMIGGFNENRNFYENSGKGLLLDVEIRCRADKILCDEEIDFESNQLAQGLAQAIQYKAASVTVWKILRNTRLNRVLMTNGEDMREAAKYYERKYNEMATFIAKRMPVENNCICVKGFFDSWVGLIK